MEGEECIYHSHHGNESKQASGDLSNLVTEIEQTDREATEDNGKVEP